MTRKDYMDGRVTHEEYYRSVAKAAGVSFNGHCFDFMAQVRKALKNGDEHLNTITLARWDRIAIAARESVSAAFNQHGDFWSLAGGVCVAKQAAKDAA